MALPGHGGRDYRGTFAERVWARVKIAAEQIETMMRGLGFVPKGVSQISGSFEPGCVGVPLAGESVEGLTGSVQGARAV